MWLWILKPSDLSCSFLLASASAALCSSDSAATRASSASLACSASFSLASSISFASSASRASSVSRFTTNFAASCVSLTSASLASSLASLASSSAFRRAACHVTIKLGVVESEKQTPSVGQTLKLLRVELVELLNHLLLLQDPKGHFSMASAGSTACIQEMVALKPHNSLEKNCKIKTCLITIFFWDGKNCYFGLSPCSVTVTTKILRFSVGETNKPINHHSPLLNMGNHPPHLQSFPFQLQELLHLASIGKRRLQKR